MRRIKVYATVVVVAVPANLGHEGLMLVL